MSRLKWPMVGRYVNPVYKRCIRKCWYFINIYKNPVITIFDWYLYENLDNASSTGMGFYQQDFRGGINATQITNGINNEYCLTQNINGLGLFSHVWPLRQCPGFNCSEVTFWNIFSLIQEAKQTACVAYEKSTNRADSSAERIFFRTILDYKDING